MTDANSMFLNFFKQEDMEKMAKAAGLDMDTTRKTLETMSMAFLASVSKNQDFLEIMVSAGAENTKVAIDAVGQTTERGKKLMAEMFGSDEISKAISKQIELASGVQEKAVQTLMPMAAQVFASALSSFDLKNILSMFGMDGTSASQDTMKAMSAMMDSFTAKGAGEFNPFSAFTGDKDSHLGGSGQAFASMMDQTKKLTSAMNEQQMKMMNDFLNIMSKK